MPTKRPVPLSDAALGHKGDTSNELAIGETNAGVPLPVKNTFIDMPSGLTPVNSPSKDAHPSSTAPAQVHLREGWVDRAIDRGTLDAVEETVDSPANVSNKPGVSGLSSTTAAQRPGSFAASAPLMTPSPTGQSMFGESRYQLFGGPPPPIQEALGPPPGPELGQPCRQGAPTPGLGDPSDPHRLLLSVPPPSQAPPPQHHLPPLYAGGFGGAPPYYDYNFLGPPGARISEPFGVQDFARRNSLEKDSDDDDDSEAERRQALLAAAGMTVENAPKPPPGAEHPSLGSAFHDNGSCKRCCFFPRNRCLNGYECEFCHYEHEKRKRKNKKNKKKKAGEHAEDYYSADAVSHMPDLGWQPAPAHHAPPLPLPHPQAVPPEYPEYVDGPLTYQWTDGTVGQTPPPPIIPGYERLVTVAVQRVQRATAPHREGPALATNPPPNPNQYDAYDRTSPAYHPYDVPAARPAYRHPHPAHHPHTLPPPHAHPHAPHPLPVPVHGLDPAAAPWHPPPFPSAASNGAVSPDIMSYPPPSQPLEDPRPLATIEEGIQDPRPFDLLTAPGPQTPQPGKPSDSPSEKPSDKPTKPLVAPITPIKVEKVAGQGDGPNMPPPDQSPKLSNDLMASLQQDPPPPDESPT
ncbi:unnamed protein product [Symbiodinium natans]|uniref:C3H1-type domain-containing protein n=1 Tax=Symbiodinium natans TaxID=878477 RepID=A0A812PK64_9DINO|nr:unnamed protein product [Symbiodinium natans]